MTKITPMEQLHRDLKRRVRLLESKRGETCTKPVSVRLTETENNTLNNMCDIFGLNRGVIIKLCIRTAAEHVVECHDMERLNNIVMGK